MGIGARLEARLDESVQYVLPLLPLLKVAHAVPKTREELRRLLSPLSATAEQQLDRLFCIVESCRSEKLAEKNA